MRIAGLFIGVDVQQDTTIPALKFAGRDALAFWAIHTDANVARRYPESNTAYLIGLDATRDRVLRELDALVERTRNTEFGLAHIHISAHGLPDGRLVLNDTVRADHAATALELSEVTERLAKVSANHVVLTLDCCFAGTVRGMGDSSNATGFTAALQAVAGEERTVAWASSPEEEAFESARFGHGLFSHGLIEGLRSTYARDGERILLERWIRHAMDYALRESIKVGRRQTPGAQVRLAPGAWIPVPPHGPRQQRFLEDSNVFEITTDPGSLAVYGFDDVTISSIRRRVGNNQLHEMQADAVSVGGVLAGKNVVVWAPTSSGKTLVGELAVLRALQQRRKAVVLLPTRALVHEQWAAFDAAFGGLGIRVARSSGEVSDDDDLIRGNHYEVAFATYEKFAALAFARPQIFDALGVVVLDEVQLISDPSRGRTVELILARVLARRREGAAIQIVALCAPVDDLGGLEQWLEATPVPERRRPVPLIEGVVYPSGRFRYRNSETKETGEYDLPGFPVDMSGLPLKFRDTAIRGRMAEAVARALPPERNRVLIFRFTRPSTRRLSARLAGTLGRPSCDAGLAMLVGGGALAEETRAGRQLRDCLKHGVAFHTRDLRRQEREVVEKLFSSGMVTALVATTGLAMGVNTPANAVIIADHALFNPRYMSDEPLDATTYRNMSGRAGRLSQPGVDEGTSYLLAADAGTADELWERYFEAPGQTLSSGLEALTDEDFVLALLALAGEVSEADLMQIARATFDGYRHQTNEEWVAAKRATMRQAIEELICSGFVIRDDELGVLRVTVRGRACAWEGLSYSSAIRILHAVNALIGAGDPLDGFSLLVLAQLTEELDELYTPLIGDEAAILVRQAGSWFRKRPALLTAMAQGGSETTPRQQLAKRIKRVVALRQWVDGKPLESIEDVCDSRSDEPGTKFLQDVAERTSDVLRAVLVLVGEIVAAPTSASSGAGSASEDALSRRQALAVEVDILRARLEHGVTSAASEFSRLDLDLSRKEMHELVAAGIDSAASLYSALDADDRQLYGILTTPGVHRIRAVLDQRRRAGALRSSRRTDRESELLSLFGDDYAL